MATLVSVAATRAASRGMRPASRADGMPRSALEILREAASEWGRFLAGCETPEDDRRAEAIQRALILLARRPPAAVGWHGPDGLGARLTRADVHTMLRLERLVLDRAADEVLLQAALLLAYRCGLADASGEDRP